MKAKEEILGAGKYIRLVRRDGWEHVERRQVSGIVVIVPVTDDGKLILVEQFRKPVRAPVMELPAGLVGDGPGGLREDLVEAGRRELVEETGYSAATMQYLMEGPPSAGLSAERMTFFLARGLKKVGAGGGDEHENITTHEAPLDSIEDWLRGREKKGILIDPKVYVGIYFAQKK